MDTLTTSDVAARLEASPNLTAVRPLVTGAATTAEILAARARTHPQEVAIVYLGLGQFADQLRTYESLDQKARDVAALLLHRYLDLAATEVKECFLLAYPPCMEFVDAYYGALYAGATAVNVFAPESPKERRKIKSIVLDCKPAAILTHSSKLASLQAFLDEEGLGPIDLIATDLLDRTDAAAPSSLGDMPRSRRARTAFIQYTSGSTGTPKGVLVEHENLLHNLQMIDRHLDGRREGRYLGLVWLPVFHDMGLVAGVNYPIYIGRPHVLFSPVAFAQKPQRWVELLSSYGATHTGGPNFSYELCGRFAKRVDKQNIDLSRLVFALCGAEPIRAQTLTRFAKEYEPCGFHLDVFAPAYGMAETTLMATGTPRGGGVVISPADYKALGEGRFRAAAEVASEEGGTRDGAVISLVASGRRCDLQDIRIVDPQTFNELDPNEIGEIWVRSASVAKGYHQLPDETEHAFHAELRGHGGGFLRTGDLGFLDPDDNLFITGRSKEMIIINGVNHYPQDIEATVESLAEADIRRAVAFGFLRQDGREGVCVVCEVAGTKDDQEFATLSEALAKKVHRENGITVSELAFVKKGEIPRTSSGKLERRLTRSLYERKQLSTQFSYRTLT
ncbi:fatty acyl-AMP ligase [Caldimonas brevitalea]|uniref:Non-ribosomal peptide synthase n=1 Tax=Caldimonas brevitalea TaxID=413882 RepID=A0A0G3BI45_9BURK|nr:fatty acyl-AMP ligase [Caldimonas brevitalea]AKJ29032.1 Non-ribosomal peptide synthase [Caldimonas brevitalea]